jgi:hypothetical protein
MEIIKLKLDPGDVLIFKTPDRPPPEVLQGFQRSVARAFPGHNIIVLSGGIDIEALPRDELMKLLEVGEL